MPNCAIEFRDAAMAAEATKFTLGNNVYLKTVALQELFGYKYGL
jgi:hypothetical protein